MKRLQHFFMAAALVTAALVTAALVPTTAHAQDGLDKDYLAAAILAARDATLAEGKCGKLPGGETQYVCYAKNTHVLIGALDALPLEALPLDFQKGVAGLIHDTGMVCAISARMTEDSGLSAELKGEAETLLAMLQRFGDSEK